MIEKWAMEKFEGSGVGVGASVAGGGALLKLQIKTFFIHDFHFAFISGVEVCSFRNYVQCALPIMGKFLHFLVRSCK